MEVEPIRQNVGEHWARFAPPHPHVWLLDLHSVAFLAGSVSHRIFGALRLLQRILATAKASPLVTVHKSGWPSQQKKKRHAVETDQKLVKGNPKEAHHCELLNL